MREQQEPSARVQQAVETLDLAVKGAQVYGREDLVQRLTGVRRLLTEPTVTVYVVGEFKQGKSSLVNALLSGPICPVDDDIATAVPTEVRYAETPSATAHYEPDDDDPGSGWTESIPIADLTSYVSEQGNPGNRRRLRSVAVGIDRQILADGLVLVDTPGVGGLGSVHNNALAMSTLPQAHAVLFVSDASQELTGPELKFLRTAEEFCPTILLVLTKTDVYPQWRRILELDVAHLRNNGFNTVESIPASSVLKTLANRGNDHELAAESGFPELVSTLQRVVRDAEQVALTSVAHHVQAAIDQLGTTLQARKTALDHPERAGQLVADLTQARARADRLRSKSARWQAVLLDGMADVSSDVDYDLRARVRIVQADADRAIDESDPADNWDEFEARLRQRLAAEIFENYALLVHRTKEVAQLVAEYFEHEGSAIIPAEVQAPEVGRIVETGELFAGTKEPVKTGMTTFQKGLMGFGMIMLLGNAIPLLLPAAATAAFVAGAGVAIPKIAAGVGLAAGSLMGIAGFKEDRTRQLEKRRSEAKKAVRDFITDFNLQVGHNSRDDRNQMQREMREGYTKLADELQRSMSEALTAAQQAVHSNETDNKEVKRMNADIESLHMLRSRMAKLVTRTSSMSPLSTRSATGPVG